jgi:hypothetical protein
MMLAAGKCRRRDLTVASRPPYFVLPEGPPLEPTTLSPSPSPCLRSGSPVHQRRVTLQYPRHPTFRQPTNLDPRWGEIPPSELFDETPSCVTAGILSVCDYRGSSTSPRAGHGACFIFLSWGTVSCTTRYGVARRPVPLPCRWSWRVLHGRYDSCRW